MPFPRDVDGGWAWWVLVASYLNILLCSGLGYLAGVYQVVFLDQFQGSVALTSWVTSLFSSLMQLAGPLSSVISNRFSCRVSVMVGGCLVSIGLFISGLADGLGVMLVSFGLLAGTGLGLIYTASIVIVSFYFHKRRTLVNGLALSATGLGFVMGPQVTRILFDHFSWRESLAILAGVAANCCVAGALMFPIHENPSYSIYSHDSDFINGDYKLSEGSNSDNECKVSNGDTKEGNERTKYDGSNLELSNLPTYYCGYDDNKMTSDSQSNEEICDASESLLQKFTPESETRKRMKGQCNSKDGDHFEIIPLVKITDDNIIFNSSKSCQEVSSSSNCKKSFADDDEKIIEVDPNGEAACKEKPPDKNILSLCECSGKYDEDIARTDLNDVKDNNVNDDQDSINQNIVLTPSEKLPSASTASDELRNKDIDGHCNSAVVASDELRNKDIDGHCNSAVVASYPKLYRNREFWILCASLFISNAGCGVFNVHVPSFLKSQGLSGDQVTNVLSMNGVAILCGRSLVGALANSVPGNDLLFFMVMHVVGGLFMCLMPVLGTSYIPNLLIIFGIGSYAGTVYAVLPTLTIQLVGLERLATAFGIEMVCAGIGYLVSPPLAGLLVDLTGGYEYNILCGGLLFILAGLVLMVLPCIQSSALK